MFVGQEYNYLIDGGHAKHLSNIVSCMDEYGVMMGHGGIKLNGIIVTHPDGDHLNGVTKLLEKHKQAFLNNYDVVITEAFYWKSKKDVCTRFLKLMDKVYNKRDISGTATCLTPGLNCYFPKESGCLLRCTARDDKVRCIQPSETFVKEAPKHVDANETSILTVINQSERKCDAVLTGDSTAREILPLVEGKEIGIFQVPHHGSYSNSRLKDKCKLVEYSGQYNLSIVHNNEVKEILLFYSTFRAQCYLISAGGTESYKHPHPYILQGIILANSLRHQECVIVLTNSRGLNSEKLKHLHRLAPQWTQYVKIHHLDDVFFTEQYHTSLRPERCISDVRANTVEWTPGGYINRTKIMLPVKPTISDHRPLEKNQFMEQSTVEITIQGMLKFNAHIICIPLPHNPRSGDSINCCYVIEESIASGVDLSKALFLLDNDERIRSLSRAKKYVLFQYINNEWQKKQLPATVQDKSPQGSPCHIPYDSINSLWPVQDTSTPISPSLTPQRRINSRISSLQPAQNISPQSPPPRTPQQSTNSVQPVQNILPQSPPSHIQHQSVNSVKPVQAASPPSHIPHQSVNSVQPVQNVSPQTPPSRIQHQSVNSVQPVQNISPQIPPSHIQHQSRSSLQPVQAISPQIPPSRIQHQSVDSFQSVQNISSQIPPSIIPHQSVDSVQPVQNISFQIPPSVIPHQNVNFLQPGQAIFSPQIPPSHIPHQNINSLQPVLDSSPQITQYSIQQLHQDISTLQIGSGGATVSTNNCVGVHVPQHRVQATQQSIQQLHQDISTLQIGSGGATAATSDYIGVHVPQHRVQATQQSIMRPSPAQYYGKYESPTKGCRCKKTDCTTNRCGCKKWGLYCGPLCQCSDCKNNQQYMFHLARSQPKVIPEVGSPTKGCGCKTGCATRRCGCKKQGLRCGPSCKCKNTYFNCEN